MLEPGVNLEEMFKQNMIECGVAQVVKPLRGYSFEIIKGWTAPIDLLFIDANHEYDSVLRDFIQWSAYVEAGGVVAFHDATEEWPGVLGVVSERLKAPLFRLTTRVDSLVWAVKENF